MAIQMVFPFFWEKFNSKQKFFRIFCVLLPFHKLFDPVQFIFQHIGTVSAFVLAGLLLVSPMRGHSVFGYAMHVFRANLQFDNVMIFQAKRRMQRLIKIIFRHRDVVGKCARNRIKISVDNS